MKISVPDIDRNNESRNPDQINSEPPFYPVDDQIIHKLQNILLSGFQCDRQIFQSSTTAGPAHYSAGEQMISGPGAVSIFTAYICLNNNSRAKFVQYTKLV